MGEGSVSPGKGFARAIEPAKKKGLCTGEGTYGSVYSKVLPHNLKAWS
jgi:hypothetical protein